MSEFSVSFRGRLPEWFRIRHTSNPNSEHIGRLMSNLHSVCQSAHCPNRSECWSLGTASFMVMGDVCTRGCRFCAVKTSPNPPPLDADEPENLAKAVSSLDLKYIVITSVDRDDLEDGGAGHFARCIREIKKSKPGLILETLIPDFRGDSLSLKKLIDAKPDVVSHNLETVERLSPRIRDMRAGYRQSLEVLQKLRELSGGKIITKSGIMVGFGESPEEVKKTMKDLLGAGVEILTIGQYLQPSTKHVPIKEFITPEKFKDYEEMGYDLGFKYVASGPLVRSSYKAGEPFIKGMLISRAPKACD
jgi:lipoic acid synthetase